MCQEMRLAASEPLGVHGAGKPLRARAVPGADLAFRPRLPEPQA
jgi:hypothetical protein